MKADAAFRIALENTIHHDAVEVQMGVEQRTETMDEDHGAEAGCCTGTGTVLAQHPLDGGQENVQRGIQNRRITFEVIAQALGHREHPLAHRQARDDMVSEMGGSLHHATGGAGRTDAPALAGVGHQKVVPAVGAAGAGETVGEDAALEVTAEFPFGDGGCARPGAILLKRQPGGKMKDRNFNATF